MPFWDDETPFSEKLKFSFWSEKLTRRRKKFNTEKEKI
jgi:hypothetical protein